MPHDSSIEEVRRLFAAKRAELPLELEEAFRPTRVAAGERLRDIGALRSPGQELSFQGIDAELLRNLRRGLSQLDIGEASTLAELAESRRQEQLAREEARKRRRSSFLQSLIGLGSTAAFLPFLAAPGSAIGALGTGAKLGLGAGAGIGLPLLLSMFNREE